MFRQSSAEQVRAVLERVVELFRGYGIPEKREFIDGLQELFKISDEDAVTIVDVINVKNSI